MGRSLAPGRARLEFFNLPAVCTASEGWVTAMLGTMYGIYDVLSVEGVIRADVRGPRGDGEARFQSSEEKGGGRSAAR